MLYDEVNPELKSSYSKNRQQMANLVSNSQLPYHGLKASELLTTRQLRKLRKIRSRRLTNENLRMNFIAD